jgi:hypothetical protein
VKTWTRSPGQRLDVIQTRTRAVATIPHPKATAKDSIGDLRSLIGRVPATRLVPAAVTHLWAWMTRSQMTRPVTRGGQRAW